MNKTNELRHPQGSDAATPGPDPQAPSLCDAGPIQHDLSQGTPEWHAFRAEHDGASEAAAMLGLSKFVSRTELMRQKVSGVSAEVSSVKQKLFDAGHEAEEKARPIADAILGEELFPMVWSLGRMSASCDGLTMDNSVAWEHKFWGAELADAVSRKELPDAHWPQCQQIMMVTGAERVLFMCSDGTPDKCVHMFVYPNAEQQKMIKGGWALFNAEKEKYVPKEIKPEVVAAPQVSLPAVAVVVSGDIVIRDNLAAFGAALTEYVGRINKNPETDQDFADLEATVKTLKAAEEALDASEANALAQVSSVDELRRTIANYREIARSNRLLADRVVKSEKENRRNAIMQDGAEAVKDHINGLNKRLGKVCLPDQKWADFAGKVKGLKTMSSIKNAVDTEVALAKIESSAAADRIQANLSTLNDLAKDYAFLFSDIGQIALKGTDDFTALVKMRILEHQATEAKRMEAERERIRAEEEAKARREAERLAEQERAKIRVEEEARARAESKVLEATRKIQEEQEQKAKEEVELRAQAEKARATAREAPLNEAPATLRLGQINERLAPISLSADGLASLGLTHAATGKAAKLYHERDFPLICNTLIRHIQGVMDGGLK